MRLFTQFLGIFLCAWSSFAEYEKVQIIPDASDSRNLFDAMKGVDKTEWYKMLYQNNWVDVRRDIKEFKTQDGSVAVHCNADTFNGIIINHACLVTLDRAKLAGDNAIEEKAPGLFYGFINNRTDAIALYERFLQPLLAFASMERVAVMNDDGTTVRWYRLFITCSLENDGPFLKIPRKCTISGAAVKLRR